MQSNVSGCRFWEKQRMKEQEEELRTRVQLGDRDRDNRST